MKPSFKLTTRATLTFYIEVVDFENFLNLLIFEDKHPGNKTRLAHTTKFGVQLSKVFVIVRSQSSSA